jgi:hypothetical protein
MVGFSSARRPAALLFLQCILNSLLAHPLRLTGNLPVRSDRMNRTHSYIFAALVLGCFAFAQDQSTSKPSGQGTETALQGCVKQSGDEYTLVTSKHKNVELESTDDLKPHVGHTVKVMGMWDKAADKSEAAGKGHEGQETAGTEAKEHHGAKEHHFKVSTLEMVSDSCSASAKSGTKSK